jgi:DNA helicase-2/ATP-dependent DNA helicase PcrA
MSSNNKLLIAAAGSGKTTFLIDEAMKFRGEKILITTYTRENEEEIKNKFILKYKHIPSYITIQTWFSFLIQHGAKPYQGVFDEMLFSYKINGMLFNNSNYGFKFFSKKDNRWISYKEDGEFMQHYFAGQGKILSDRLPKFVVKANIASAGEVIKRISRIYSHIFVDEVQDLAGYDLEILKLLFRSNSNIILVGDPRQVTYLTHHETKYNKYKNGKIKEFITTECKRPISCFIDEVSLNKSHRNNKAICDYSSRLYDTKLFAPIEPCECDSCRSYEKEYEGIYLVRPENVDDYLSKFNPIQLRWSINKEVHPNYKVLNFGESKGKTFDRVLIYPTKEMETWVYNNEHKLATETIAKLYVAITRAKYSVGIVTNYPEGTNIKSVVCWKSIR